MPPLEAMACGAPVLSSDAASMPEILGDAALYFTSEDKEDLMRKIIKMLNMTAGERTHMKELGVLQASKYNWSDTAKKLRNILE